MKELIWTPKFLKETQKFLKVHTNLVNLFKEKIKQLEENPFNPILKTHKLKGKLSEFYASSLNYQFRIVFEFAEENDEKIILLNIGSHDEVY